LSIETFDLILYHSFETQCIVLSFPNIFLLSNDMTLPIYLTKWHALLMQFNLYYLFQTQCLIWVHLIAHIHLRYPSLSMLTYILFCVSFPHCHRVNPCNNGSQFQRTIYFVSITTYKMCSLFRCFGDVLSSISGTYPFGLCIPLRAMIGFYFWKYISAIIPFSFSYEMDMVFSYEF